MVAWKLWSDTRFRFYIGVVVMIVCAFFMLWMYSSMTKLLHPTELPSNPKVSAQAQATIAKVTGNYQAFTDHTWYISAGGLVALLAIILTLGGPLTESHSAHLTLSLPVRRHQWPVVQALLMMGMVVAMLQVSTAVFWAISTLAGQVYPPGHAVVNALLCAVPCAAWIGLTLAVGSYALDKARTALIMIPAKFLSFFVFTASPRMKAWNIGNLGQPMSMQPAHPWRPLLLVIILSVGGVALAARRFERLDY